MLPAAAEVSVHRPWIVCEPQQRWLTAVRRFAPEQLPRPLIPVVMPAEPDAVTTMLVGQGSGVILWSAGRDNLREVCQRLARTAMAAPWVLQLVAEDGLSNRERLILAEFPCAATVRNPEDLPRLRGMIRGYFARLDDHLDY